jgi:hypothetical protein
LQRRSIGFLQPESASNSNPQNGFVPQGSGGNEGVYMKNGFFSLCRWAALMLCASCAAVKPAVETPASPPVAGDASPEETFDSGHWVTRPSKDAITVIGIAGRRRNRGEAIDEALADAARKAALYHGVHAESAAVLWEGQGNLDYFSDFDYRISPDNSREAYIDSLLFDEDKDILEKDGALIVRARYLGEFEVPVYETAVENGIPLWVKNYSAAIPGFLAGVGYSRNKGSLQKTHTASYETALASILPGNASSEVIDADGARATGIVTRSEGDLVNVMILETWLDKKTKSVWTLVAAKGSDS